MQCNVNKELVINKFFLIWEWYYEDMWS
jgi:hypothetical protein